MSRLDTVLQLISVHLRSPSMKFLLSLLLGIFALVACSPTAPAAPTEPAAAQFPSSPAGENFRADNVEWVATTGKPQLVEIFSYD